MKEFYLQNYKEILNILLTFVGTILAIFFTLFALPIQNLLGKFSQDTVNNVLYDKITLGCFITLVLIFSYNFSLMFYDAEPTAMTISIISGYFSLFLLSVLVFRVFHFLDLRNQIESRAKKIISKIKDEKYKTIDDLRDDMDYLFDFAQRSIQMDRYEYFDFTMNELTKVANAYVDKYKNISSYNEPFFMSVPERFIDLRKTVKTDNHTKIMDSLVKCMGNFGLAALKIKGTHDKYNFSANIMIDNLKDIILSGEMLRETSTAPYRAIKEIKNIAIKSIEIDCIGTTRYSIEKLCVVSTFSSRLHINLGNYVAIRSNETVSFIVYELFDKIKQISHLDSMHLRMALEDINKTLKDFYEDDHQHGYNTNVSPYYYPISNYGFSKILVNIVQKIMATDDDHLVFELLEQIEEFLSDLNQNIMMATKKGYYTEVSHILHQIYTFVVIFLNFKRVYDDQNKKYYEPETGEINSKIRVRFKICDILGKELLSIFYNPIYSVFETKSNKVQYWDYIDIYTSIIGIMLCEQKKETSFSGNDSMIIREWIKGIFDFIEKHKNNLTYEEIGKTWNKYEIIHPLSSLYFSIKLIGGWLYLLDEKLYFTRIKQIIKEQPEITKEKNSMGFEPEIIGYWAGETVIVDSHGSKKFLTPPYLVPLNFTEYNKKLFDVGGFRKYLDELDEEKTSNSKKP